MVNITASSMSMKVIGDDILWHPHTPTHHETPDTTCSHEKRSFGGWAKNEARERATAKQNHKGLLSPPQRVVKVGQGPAQEASRRGAVHLIKKL